MIALAEAPSGTSLELVDLLVGLLEFRDPYFRGGSSLTRLLATAVGTEMGYTPAQNAHLALAALLRDLGRVAVGGRLVASTASELDGPARDSIERHVDTTLQLLEGVTLPPEVRGAVRHHHERWDGAGYPDRLSGEDIPLDARIIAVADSFAAMMAPRPYRLPKRIPEAVDELRSQSGTRYDAEVVAALVRVLARRDQRSLAFGLRHYVLVMDADEQAATATAAKLCSNGYLAEVVPDADSARERLKRSPIDALVLCARQPEDAAVLLAEVRAGQPWRDIPVVVTNADDADIRVSLLESGADACFPRRTAFGELRATLASLLGRAVRTRAEAQSPSRALSGSQSPWHALQGDLRDFPLGWLLQVMKYDSRTAVLSVWAGDDEGTICLERGDPSHAETRNAMGVDAVRQMLTWEQGTFVVHPNATTGDRTVDCSLMHLLLDQAVSEDHTNRVFGAVSGD